MVVNHNQAGGDRVQLLELLALHRKVKHVDFTPSGLLDDFSKVSAMVQPQVVGAVAELHVSRNCRACSVHAPTVGQYEFLVHGSSPVVNEMYSSSSIGT
jgi:hypothetical protein